MANELDKTKLLPFRSVAFASVSRSEPESSSILLPLLAIALTKDYAFQETLLVAANSAPNRHGKIVWQVVVELLEKVGKELVNKATEIAAELLTRLKTAKGICFQLAVEAAINSRGGNLLASLLLNIPIDVKGDRPTSTRKKAIAFTWNGIMRRFKLRQPD
jgi:hypothetical protein